MVVLQEAIESVCAYFGVSSMQLLVEHLINGVLERSTTGRKKVGHLLGLLLKRNILLRKQFEAGLKSVLQIADVLLVDIPKIWDYLGELIGNFLFVVATNTLKIFWLSLVMAQLQTISSELLVKQLHCCS